MTSPFLGEFMGTLFLVLLGDGVVANVLLKKSKAENAGWLAITTGWCFAVMAGIFVAIACGSQDAHINPAVTVGLAVRSGDFSKVAPYLPAQVLGAFAGAVLVWIHFYPHWKETDDAVRKRLCFCTAPAIRNYLTNLGSEIIATFVLVFVIAAIYSPAVGVTGMMGGWGMYLVSCLVWGIGLSLGGTTGYAMNPARDFGPRLAHAILPIAGKGMSDWNYASVPVIGPLIGAALAGVVIRVIHF
jgi:glycerol uptake facilitator protein